MIDCYSKFIYSANLFSTNNFLVNVTTFITERSNIFHFSGNLVYFRKNTSIVRSVKSKYTVFEKEKVWKNHLHLMFKFPCLVFEKSVVTNHNGTYCDISHCWIHIYCNICTETCRHLQKDQSPWFWKLCSKIKFLFPTSGNLSHFCLAGIFLSISYHYFKTQL